jgi:hypothetical protein
LVSAGKTKFSPKELADDAVFEFGYLGYPGRAAMAPEITIFELAGT